MHTGMLWFDNSQSELTLKIQKAVEYYQKKYGREPDLILLHPSMMKDNMRIDASFEIQVGKTKIMIRPYRPVLPGYIWIGIDDKQ